MSKYISILPFLFITFPSEAQKLFRNEENTIVFSDSVKKYFNYDTLQMISCKDVEIGLYSLSFNISGKNIPTFLEFSHTNSTIENLFKNAINKSLQYAPIRKGKNYIMFFYYINSTWCSKAFDTGKVSTNVYRDVANLLGNQLTNIKKSIPKGIKGGTKRYKIIGVSIIDDNNPNRTPGKRIDPENFTPKSRSKEEIKILEQKLKKK